MEIETDCETIEVASGEYRVCPECGAAFVPRCSTQVCCSDECKAARRNRLRREREADREARRLSKTERQTAAAERKEKARRRAEFFAARDAAFERAGLPAPRIEVRNGVRVERRGTCVGGAAFNLSVPI